MSLLPRRLIGHSGDQETPADLVNQIILQREDLRLLAPAGLKFLRQ